MIPTQPTSTHGFQGFICEITTEPVLPAECLACARKGAPGCTMTAPVIKGILSNLRPDDFGLTVTTLLGCARKARLKLEQPYWLKPSELWWSYRGQLMHNIAAQYAHEDAQAIAEQRFSMMVQAHGQLIEISGQPDLVLVDRGVLVDYKTTKRMPQTWKTYTCPEAGNVIQEGQWAIRTKYIECPFCEDGRHVAKDVLAQGKPRAYQGHIQQVSVYAVMLRENGIPIQTAEIIYQDMAGQLRVPVELLPTAEVWALLEQRVAEHTQAGLPGIITDAEQTWECDYCALRSACEALHGGPVGAVLLKAQAAEQNEAQLLKELGY